jgi:hypothetical protein
MMTNPRFEVIGVKYNSCTPGDNMYVIHAKDRLLDIRIKHHLAETFLCTSIVIWVVQFRIMIVSV